MNDHSLALPGQRLAFAPGYSLRGRDTNRVAEVNQSRDHSDLQARGWRRVICKEADIDRHMDAGAVVVTEEDRGLVFRHALYPPEPKAPEPIATGQTYGQALLATRQGYGATRPGMGRTLRLLPGVTIERDSDVDVEVEPFLVALSHTHAVASAYSPPMADQLASDWIILP